ncbi:MAG: glycine cleavage system protein H [Promethearchaeia archaeon]
MSEIKDGLHYTKTHQWYNPDTNKVGLTAYAADSLGEISFVDLDAIRGEDLSQVEMDGDEPSSAPIDAMVESNKAVGDIFSPLSGNVTAINDELLDFPEKVNDDPYGEGWLFELDPSDFDGEKGELLSADEYAEFVEGLD